MPLAKVERAAARLGGRKVRTPKGREVANSDRERSQGKWHRKHTAAFRRGKGEKAR